MAENIFLGHEVTRGILLDRATMHRRTEELLASIGVKVSPGTLVKNLSIANQQMIEIAKALSKNARIIVFDEPTSSLTDAEISELFRIIASLRENGVGMFYISHRLEEIFQIGDRITIMRDGKKIATAPMESMDMDKVVEGIAGRKIQDVFQRTSPPRGKCCWRSRTCAEDVSRT